MKLYTFIFSLFFFFFQAEDGIRDLYVTGVQTCALPISQNTGDRQSHASPRCGRLHKAICRHLLFEHDLFHCVQNENLQDTRQQSWTIERSRTMFFRSVAVVFITYNLRSGSFFTLRYRLSMWFSTTLCRMNLSEDLFQARLHTFGSR